MKLAEFKEKTEGLKHNDIVTIAYYSNWSGRKLEFQTSGEFQSLLDDGERIKLWNRSRSLSYRSVTGIARGET